MKSAPSVSIILPTYNRSDVIHRAIDSVRQQTFEDWELLVIDDGSTDSTADLVEGLDSRISVTRQQNAGVYTARNVGLNKARGRWITFLDSDDRWAPFYLALTTGFLRAHEGEAFVTTEFYEDWGAGHATRQDLTEIRGKYARRAKAIGSNLFALPPGESDDYLRVYSSREQVGEWGRAALASADVSTAQVYRGHIFRHMQFGYLNWLPTTMLTRDALQAVGNFATHTRNAADYQFLCRLTRAFRANMIAVPCATKYDRAPTGGVLRQGHLASGHSSYLFDVNKLAYFDEMFTSSTDRGPETEVLRRHHSLSAARAALALGMRREAIAHLRQAAALRRRLWRAYPGLAYARLMPSDRGLGIGVRALAHTSDLGARLLKGEVTWSGVLRQVRRVLSL